MIFALRTKILKYEKITVIKKKNSKKVRVKEKKKAEVYQDAVSKATSHACLSVCLTLLLCSAISQVHIHNHTLTQT